MANRQLINAVEFINLYSKDNLLLSINTQATPMLFHPLKRQVSHHCA